LAPAYPVLCGTHNARLPGPGLGFFILDHRVMVTDLPAQRPADQRGQSVTPRAISATHLASSAATAR
jgi:hypothetical protein